MSWSIAGSPRPDVCVHVGGGAGRAGGTGARRGLGRGCVPGASLGIKPPVYIVMAVPGVEFELEGIKAVDASRRWCSSRQSTKSRCPVRQDGRHSHGLGGRMLAIIHVCVHGRGASVRVCDVREWRKSMTRLLTSLVEFVS